MSELRDALKACEERLDKWRRPGQRIGEQNTKAMLIDPLLSALGPQGLQSNGVGRHTSH